MCRAVLLIVAYLVAVQAVFSVSAAEPASVHDVPLHKDASDVSVVRRRGDIRFKVASDMKSVGQFYATTLGEQRWTKSKKDNLQRDFWVQSFAKGDLSLEVRVEQRAAGSEVRLTPKGFEWDEDRQPRPKDIPIPPDPKDVKYDDFFERIAFQHSMTPEQLADFYGQKLDAKTWAKSGTDVVTKDRVTLLRTSGKSSITIVVGSADELSAVTIRTKGMVWDEIKAANEQQKKTAAEVADRKSEPMKSGQSARALPKRKEKPKQGIANREKLRSSCVLTIDGNAIELPSVIAYEAVSSGQWRTKIVATESSVKQQVLLELLKKTGADEGWELGPPFVKLELNDEDVATRLSFQAQNVFGAASGADMGGDALVEDGRVRGMVQLKPITSFKRKIAASITFDVPLLTADSVPEKRLANVPRLAQAGKLTVGDKTYVLASVTVYETKQFDKTVTAVLLTEKPINLAKLKSSLQKPAQNDDDFTEFQPQIKFIVDASERVRSYSLWADNFSVSASGSDDFRAQIQVEDLRARGTAKTINVDDTGKQKFAFDVSFDTDVIPLSQVSVK